MSREDIRAALDRFLADCVRRTLCEESWPAWPFAATTPEIVALTSERVNLHGIAGLLGQAHENLLGWPEPVAQAVRDLMRRGALEEQLTRGPVAALIEGLAAQGVRTLAMKGCALAYGYHPHPQIRPRGDTDLLIDECNLVAARGVLEQSGWRRPSGHHGIFFQETWRRDCGGDVTHALDLHWRPTDRPVLQKLLREEEFWAGAEPLPRLSPHACTPGPLQLLLHAVVNQIWHENHGFVVDGKKVVGARRLIWAVDIERVAARFSPADWELLLRISVEREAASAVHRVMTWAIAEIGAQVPDAVLSRLEAASDRSAVSDYLGDAGWRQTWREDLGATRGLAERTRLLWMNVMAPRAHLVKKYPRAAHWPTFALRIWRIGSAATRLMTGRSSAGG